jgi:ABC-2 type transport system permease protein
LVGDALVQLPAVWVLAGIGTALFGLVPRLAALTWAALAACLLLLELGALLKLSHWFVDASPFAHVPKLPGTAVTATPLVALTAIAVALVAAGLVGFRRRDLG